ncbi:hypothetical protein ACFE04_001816 [Oxalis oulophora]
MVPSMLVRACAPEWSYVERIAKDLKSRITEDCAYERQERTQCPNISSRTEGTKRLNNQQGARPSILTRDTWNNKRFSRERLGTGKEVMFVEEEESINAIPLGTNPNIHSKGREHKEGKQENRKNASEIGLGGLLFIAMFRTLAIRLSFFDGENALSAVPALGSSLVSRASKYS